MSWDSFQSELLSFFQAQVNMVPRKEKGADDGLYSMDPDYLVESLLIIDRLGNDLTIPEWVCSYNTIASM